MSSCSVNAIPTLVELEKVQYDNITKLISEIAIDIEGENITLNADFYSLIRLQTQTIQAIDSFQALYQNQEYFRDVQLTNAFNMIGEGLKNINNTNKEILASIQSADTSNQQILGQILAAITTLDSNEEDRKNEWYAKFETIMNPLSQSLSDVSNTINIISSTTDAVYGIFEIFQNTQDVYIEQIAANVEIISTNFLVGMKTIIAEATVGSMLACADSTLDECAYDPFGVGPIECVGAELVACDLLPIPASEETVSHDPKIKRRCAPATDEAVSHDSILTTDDEN